MSLPIHLAGHIALVTGGARGIGLGCARRLAAAGAHTILVDIDAVEVERAADALRAEGHVAEHIVADLVSLEAIAHLFAQVQERHGQLDILVNNAGFNLFKGVQDTTPAEFDAVVGLDLRSLFFITQAAVPLMKVAGGGSIINIASVHAAATIGTIAAYAAAKGGVVALTRSLCQELGPFGIRVNVLSPGFVQTPLMERWLASEPDPDATLRRVNGLHPVGRIGTADEIGSFVAFLASEHGAFITGAHLVQDGGLTTRLMH